MKFAELKTKFTTQVVPFVTKYKKEVGIAAIVLVFIIVLAVK